MMQERSIEHRYRELTARPALPSGDPRRPRIASVSLMLPGEIVTAAGCEPLKLLGLEEGISPEAHAMLNSNMCSYILHCLTEAIALGRDTLDCIIIADTCDTRRRMYEAWSHFLPDARAYCLRAPKADSPPNRRYFRQELERLARYLESTFNCEITPAGLRESIAEHNVTRMLLQEINGLRGIYRHQLTADKVHQIVKASFCSRPSVFNPKLSEFIGALSRIEKDHTADGHRIVVCGSYFDNAQICDLVERNQGVIVCEDNSLGHQYFGELIASDGEMDPLGAIADYYFDKALHSAYFSSEARAQRLLNLCAEYEADAIIFTSLKFCDCNAIDFCHLRRRVSERSLPILYLEFEHLMVNTGSVHTRIETFMRSLSSRVTGSIPWSIERNSTQR